MKFLRLLTVSLAAALLLPSARAGVKPSNLFSDNMVLQQKTAVNVWGTASPGETVTVSASWDSKKYRTVCGEDGKWKIPVRTPAAGGPYTLTIKGKDSKVVLQNVLVGEVWLCSGQSNMEFELAGNYGYASGWQRDLAESGRLKKMRILHVGYRTAPAPQDTAWIKNGGWQECSMETLTTFSGTAFYFGRELLENLDVPIGLIESCVGGTHAEAWTSLEGLKTLPEMAEYLEVIPKGKNTRKMQEWIGLVTKTDPGYVDGKPAWAAPDFDDSSWEDFTLPWAATRVDKAERDSFTWLRREVDVPQGWAGRDLEIAVGHLGEKCTVFYDGETLCSMKGPNWVQARVPARLVHAGRSVITFHIMSRKTKYQDSPDRLRFFPADEHDAETPLIGTWKKRNSMSTEGFPQAPFQYGDATFPSSLYNGMIAPLKDFAVKGAIWYQGESNVERADRYAPLLSAMIGSWRDSWSYGFPFYIVQLANYGAPQTQAEDLDWPRLREAQTRTARSVGNSGLAVTIDIGDANDIHPKDKLDVGYRLALLARAKTYGEDIVCEGPVYEGYEIEGSRIRVRFTSADGLRACRGSSPSGFYIAGNDRVFHEAEAVIDGKTVLVSSPQVPEPVSVRYGWADNPFCDLYNSSLLPACPFRTDDW